MRSKNGFTLVEISLFLALSAVLFMAITIGVQNSIYQQRYNDSVQSFTDFLRDVYSEVTNVQSNADGGTSNQAIYGKLVTFGESTNLAGDENDEHAFFVYNVIGNINGDISTGSTVSELEQLKVNVLSKDSENVEYAGMVKSYTMKWSSSVQNTDNTDYFKGALLVVRNPKSGVVNTFAMKGETIEVNAAFRQAEGSKKVPEDLLTKNLSKFSAQELDFCVNPYNDESMDNRADVRINKNAKNSAGINTHYDNDDNKCRKQNN